MDLLDFQRRNLPDPLSANRISGFFFLKSGAIAAPSMMVQVAVAVKYILFGRNHKPRMSTAGLKQIWLLSLKQNERATLNANHRKYKAVSAKAIYMDKKHAGLARLRGGKGTVFA